MTINISREQILSFAELSGDFSPIHVDSSFAHSCGYDKIVAHGALLICEALEYFPRNETLKKVESIHAEFRGAVSTGDSLEINWEGIQGKYVCLITRGETVISKVKVLLEDGPLNVLSAPLREAFSIPKAVEWVVGNSYTVFLEGDPLEIENSYPNAYKKFGPGILAAIFACSRAVGMQIPGKDAILRSFTIQIDEKILTNLGTSRVVRVDERFNVIDQTINFKGISAEVSSGYRPKPAPLLRVSQANDMMADFDLRGTRALVIGATKGLGNACAKLLYAAGSYVTISGRSSIESNVSSIPEIFYNEYMSLDLERIDTRTISNSIGIDYDYVFYFATPRIERGADNEWRSQVYERFLNFYVELPAEIVNALPKLSGLFIPSSTFLNESPAGFREYVGAKTHMELELQKLFGDKPGFRLEMPRLPAVLTQQTNASIATKGNDLASIEAAAIMLRASISNLLAK